MPSILQVEAVIPPPRKITVRGAELRAEGHGRAMLADTSSS